MPTPPLSGPRAGVLSTVAYVHGRKHSVAGIGPSALPNLVAGSRPGDVQLDELAGGKYEPLPRGCTHDSGLAGGNGSPPGPPFRDRTPKKPGRRTGFGID